MRKQGCTARFCMASYLTLPFRAAPLEASLLPAIQQGLQVTDRIGLLGASVTQHPEFEALLHWILQTERESLHLSIASVRTNTVTPLLASALAARCVMSRPPWPLPSLPGDLHCFAPVCTASVVPIGTQCM